MCWKRGDLSITKEWTWAILWFHSIKWTSTTFLRLLFFIEIFAFQQYGSFLWLIILSNELFAFHPPQMRYFIFGVWVEFLCKFGCGSKEVLEKQMQFHRDKSLLSSLRLYLRWSDVRALVMNHCQWWRLSSVNFTFDPFRSVQTNWNW